MIVTALAPLLAAAFVRDRSGCRTVVSDPAPPANVRSAPNGTIVGTLSNRTALRVVATRDGWLHVTAPLDGWIAYAITSVRCGKGGGDEFADVPLMDLAHHAGDDRATADLLVRARLTGTMDGGAGEAVNEGLGLLMESHPALLLSVLDAYPAAARRETLTQAATPAGIVAMDRAADARPTSPAARTWRAIPASERLSRI